MKAVQHLLTTVLLIVILAACTGPRDAGTSSARAAYATPTSNTYRYSDKKKSKKKKTKSSSVRNTKKRNVDEARERRKGIGM